MGWMVIATPRPLYPRERSGTHYIRVWVVPSSFQTEFDPWTVQPIESRTDYAITEHFNIIAAVLNSELVLSPQCRILLERKVPWTVTS